MKRKQHIVSAIALTIAGIGGTQAAQAQNATLDAARNGDPIARLFVNGYVHLGDDYKLVLSYRDSPAQLKAANIQGATDAQYAEEKAAKKKLDRAAAPVIQSWLDDPNGLQLSTNVIDPVFELLGQYLTLHGRNMGILAANARAAGKEDAVLAILAVDDMAQGGSLAGFAKNEGTLQSKREAVLDHYTGVEALGILMDAGYDIQLASRGQRMRVDGAKHTITFFRDVLIQPKQQQIGAYALRSFALRVAESEKPIGRDSYLVQPVEGPFGNLLRGRRRVGLYDDAIDFSIGHPRYVMGLKIIEDLRNLPPEPVAPVPQPTTKPSHKKLKR